LQHRSVLGVTVIVLAIIDIVVELQALPLLYRGMPIPFPETSKPIGESLFSAASLHMILIGSNLLILMLVLKKAGYKGESLPSRKSDWLDLFAFLALVFSGLAMWFYPMFMIVFIASGIYLLLTEMR
jgi:hypothetical protein